ncbi:MAG: glycosyltransferase [Actinobacteria bacterium]|nr:glycosyltransferase [Actinomycetota bacterium]MBU1609652.1 glycosyltransferase [Actinomycetota bacterium]MBU2314865.1 glycosyltransferase [Actinomycetota bacterium]MBU2385195.1 glycosyltransferase [Actinomycetota bacterium]
MPWLPELLAVVITITAVILLVQSLVNIQQTLYIWERPDRLEAARRPATLEAPLFGFTVLLPARHEQEVIGETLRRLSESDYPPELVELMVICTTDDIATIAAAEAAIAQHSISNARVLTFDQPAGKSRAMNLGLADAQHELVTIFDSEDDVSAEIFSIANTLFIRRDIDVLQCGVQLMDFDSHWFAAHNVLEYFFWFKSRMHYFARAGAVPLGGNTVFFKADDLKSVGGWDEDGLTEDADLGIRLSIAGKRFDVMYDARHVTREEVPHDTRGFVKQRTRWNQGFLQILRKKEWLQLRSARHRILIGYVLTAPTYMALVIAFAPVVIVIGATTKLPVLVSMLSFLPLLLAAIMLLISLVGLHEFGKDQHVRVRFLHYLVLVGTFIPYQFLLMVSAVRALVREIRGSRGWEKTAHAGRHRLGAQDAQPVLITARVPASQAT